VIADESSADVAADATDAAGLAPARRLLFGARRGWVDIRRAASVLAPSLPDARRPGLPLWYTSGTTGRPKGVMQRMPPESMAALTQASADHATAYEWTDRDVSLVQGPLYHAGPLASALTILHQGGLVVIMDKWTPVRCLELIDRYGVTASMMVPTMLHRLTALPEETRRAFHLRSLRPNGIMVGGARCPAHTKTAMIRWWGPVFVEAYGGSEATFSRISSEEALLHPGSVGRGRPGVTLCVLDDAGEECPPGAVGTVYARFADQAAHRPAYLNAPEKTAGSYVGDYFTLGDMGYLDEEGWLYLVDRRADLIVTGGANVYPAEVERVLAEHDAVDDVVVIGLPDDEWGHVVHAIVVAREAATDGLVAALHEHCRRSLAAFKCPRGFTFASEIDRTEMGKISRRKLREQFLDGVDGRFGATSTARG
jgi:long-chain acyl-CoA synthetase